MKRRGEPRATTDGAMEARSRTALRRLFDVGQKVAPYQSCEAPSRLFDTHHFPQCAVHPLSCGDISIFGRSHATVSSLHCLSTHCAFDCLDGDRSSRKSNRRAAHGERRLFGIYNCIAKDVFEPGPNDFVQKWTKRKHLLKITGPREDGDEAHLDVHEEGLMA